MIFKPLYWKPFSVDLKRVRAHYKQILSENYDGLLADEESLKVIFFNEVSDDDRQKVYSYWHSLTSETFAEPEALTAATQVRLNMMFGQVLISEFSAEPEVNALTTEQTGQLIGMLAPVQMMLFTGAVQTACQFIQGVDMTALLPQELIDKYVTKMQDYISGS